MSIDTVKTIRATLAEKQIRRRKLAFPATGIQRFFRWSSGRQVRWVMPCDAAEHRRLSLLACEAVQQRLFSDAVTLLSYAEEYALHSCFTWNLLGIAHECQGHWRQARRCYGKAVALDGRYAPVQQNLRRIYELYTFGHSVEPIAFGPLMEAHGDHETFLTKDRCISTPF